MVEQRRDRRYAFRARVAIARGRNEVAGEVENVSFNGLYVRTEAPLPARELVSVRIPLPPEGEELSVNAIVVRQVAPALASAAGTGLRLFAVGPATRERWSRFVLALARGEGDGARPAERAPSAEGPARAIPLGKLGPASAGPPQLPRTERRHRRYAAALQVKVGTREDLQVLFTENVSKGGMFVRTGLQLELATRLRVAVVHPESGEQFPLEAVVRWRGPEPTGGLGLEFVNLGDERRDEFLEFVSSVIPVEEVEFVAGGEKKA